MKTYIGIDLGGTNVRVAKVTADGQILNILKSPSYAQEGPKKVMENLIADENGDRVLRPRPPCRVWTSGIRPGRPQGHWP